MASDSDDEVWHDTYPRNVNLLLTPMNNEGVIVSLTTSTKLPYAYRYEILF
jgi:hypothetical protein